jgi:hypothetical protein
VKVEVLPPRIRVLWGKNTLIREFDVALIDSEVREAQRRKKVGLNQSAIQGLPAGFDLRGAVGLYLFRGSASFRLARIEPLRDEDGAKGKGE